MAGLKMQMEDTGGIDAAGESRAAVRHRRIARSTIAGVAARGVSVATSFATIPLAIAYLGTERYGVWVALTSISALFIVGDLGIGNALVNVVSAANGRDDTRAARRAFSAGLTILLAVAGVFGIAAVVLASLVPWADLVGARSPLASSEAAAGAAVFLALFAVGIPLSAIERVRLAYQESDTNAAWAIVASGLSLCGLLVGMAVGAGLPILIVLTVGPPLLTTAINGAILLIVDRPWLRPDRSYDRDDVRQLTHAGFMFLVLQVAVAVAYQSDVVVAANVLGPDAAATYSVAGRLFMFAPSLVSLSLAVIWPAYTEAIVRGDAAWVRRTLSRTIRMTLIGVGGTTILLLVLYEPIVGLLTNHRLVAPFGLVLGMAAWAVLSSVMNCIAILMNAAAQVRFQAVVAVLMAGTSITASFGLAHAIGLEGVILGTLGAYIVIATVPVVLKVPALFRSIEARTAVAG